VKNPQRFWLKLNNWLLGFRRFRLGNHDIKLTTPHWKFQSKLCFDDNPFAQRLLKRGNRQQHRPTGHPFAHPTAGVIPAIDNRSETLWPRVTFRSVGGENDVPIRNWLAVIDNASTQPHPPVRIALSAAANHRKRNQDQQARAIEYRLITPPKPSPVLPGSFLDYSHFNQLPSINYLLSQFHHPPDCSLEASPN